MHSRRTLVLLLLTLLAVPMCAEASAHDASRDAAAAADAAINQALNGIDRDAQLVLIVGNDVDWGGDLALLDSEWLGLICAPDCSLVPARLSRSGPDESTGHQTMLHFETDTGGIEALAWLRRDPRHPWLVAGAVARYGATARANSPGSFERSIATPTVGGAALIPLIAPAGAGEASTIYLQLREDGRRQLLPGRLISCAGDGVPLGEYLH